MSESLLKRKQTILHQRNGIKLDHMCIILEAGDVNSVLRVGFDELW